MIRRGGDGLGFMGGSDRWAGGARLVEVVIRLCLKAVWEHVGTYIITSLLVAANVPLLLMLPGSQYTVK